MKQLWDRVAPKIWTRLFLMVVAAILLTWIVVGASIYWLGNARLVVTDLSTVQAPRLAQTSRLSAQTADLAMLSNRILSEGATTPDNLETMLKASVRELNVFINEGLDTTLTPHDAETLQRQLLLVIRNLNQAQQIETRLRNQIEQLRWLNVDVQDEAAAVMADFAYNIEVLTRRLAQEPDAILVEQVLVNLLSNSCDAIAATGEKGEILIRKEDSPADQLTFSIVDTGIGLGDLEPERAFEPFVTTKDPGAGLGLGLSISFNIITGMNGTLTLGARADVGTRATVTMPMHPLRPWP